MTSYPSPLFDALRKSFERTTPDTFDAHLTKAEKLVSAYTGEKNGAYLRQYGKLTYVFVDKETPLLAISELRTIDADGAQCYKKSFVAYDLSSNERFAVNEDDDARTCVQTIAPTDDRDFENDMAYFFTQYPDMAHELSGAPFFNPPPKNRRTASIAAIALVTAGLLTGLYVCNKSDTVKKRDDLHESRTRPPVVDTSYHPPTPTSSSFEHKL